MIGVLATLKAKPGSEQAFEEAMTDLARQVRENEPGNHLYRLCRDDDGNYVMMEIYEDEDALAAHRDSEHFKAAGRKLGELIAGPPQITRYTVVG